MNRRETLNRIPGVGQAFHRGMSLVEILVVLVLLITGMLALARIFPEGFVSLDYTGNVTLGQALAKYNEDFLNKRRENLPDGIVAVDYLTGLVRTVISPGEMYTEKPYTDNVIAGYAGPPPADPRFTGANHVRHVVGEQFKISPPRAVSVVLPNESVSLYQALFSPLYSATFMPGTALGVAAYSGTPNQRVVLSDPPTTDELKDLLTLGVLGYGINYEQALVYVPAVTYPRLYKIEYVFRTGTGTPAQMVPDNCILFDGTAGAVPNPDPTGTLLNPIQLQVVDLRRGQVTDATHDLTTGLLSLGSWRAIPPTCPFVPLPANGSLDPGSDFLYRRFNQIPANQAFGQDPYEFKVYSTLTGLMGFHPVMATLPTLSTQGRGLTVKLDYDLDDWFILRQDLTVPNELVGTPGPDSSVPAAPFHSIRLSTGAIKKVGELEDTINFREGMSADQNTFEYQGLVRYYPGYTHPLGAVPARAGTPGIDVLIVDQRTGFQLDSRTLQRPNSGGPAGSNNNDGHVDYDAGVIHLRSQVTLVKPDGSTAGTVSPAGRLLRVYYRAAKDFSVATLKPYSAYFRQPNLLLIGDKQYGQYSFGYLLFNEADGEKTVAVDYTWQEIDASGNPGEVHVESQELQQLQPPGTAVAPTGLPPQAQGKWWIRLGHSDADPSRTPDQGADVIEPTPGNARYAVVPGSIRIIGVRGASLQTRVLWRQNNRWRHLQRSSILTRSLSR